MYIVNVSSISDFYRCRFRWWCRWIMNRVPKDESPALGFGKLLHEVFEEHFRTGIPLGVAAQNQWEKYRVELEKLPLSSPGSYAGSKVITLLDDLMEALPLWKDTFEYDAMLECEKPFEIVLPEWSENITWRGRPDFMGISKGRIWHRQNRGLAASMNFGTYLGLAKRHYHEHLYMEYAVQQYADLGLKYGGTEFNLVRKLKYRTNAGKKNEKTKTAEEMFFSMPLPLAIDSPLHRSVMTSMVQHVDEMIRVTFAWEARSEIPPPNESLNGGFSGSLFDPYFRVLIGEIKLSDDSVFKDRVDMYASEAANE